MNAIEFGKELRNYRISQGKTLDDIGLMVYPTAHRSTVSKWESGKYLPSVTRLKQLCDVLSIDFNNLSSRESPTDVLLKELIAEQERTNRLLKDIKRQIERW